MQYPRAPSNVNPSTQNYISFSKWFVDIKNTKYHRVDSNNNRHVNPSTPSDRSRKNMKSQKKKSTQYDARVKSYAPIKVPRRRRPSFLGRRRTTRPVLKRPRFLDAVNQISSRPSDRSQKNMKVQKKNHLNPMPESKVMLR